MSDAFGRVHPGQGTRPVPRIAHVVCNCQPTRYSWGPRAGTAKAKARTEARLTHRVRLIAPIAVGHDPRLGRADPSRYPHLCQALWQYCMNMREILRIDPLF